MLLRGLLLVAAYFFGIYDLVTGDPFGWPITICTILLTAFFALRVAFLLYLRRLQRAERARQIDGVAKPLEPK